MPLDFPLIIFYKASVTFDFSKIIKYFDGCIRYIHDKSYNYSCLGLYNLKEKTKTNTDMHYPSQHLATTY